MLLKKLNCVCRWIGFHRSSFSGHFHLGHSSCGTGGGGVRPFGRQNRSHYDIWPKLHIASHRQYSRAELPFEWRQARKGPRRDGP